MNNTKLTEIVKIGVNALLKYVSTSNRESALENVFLAEANVATM